MFLPPQTLCGFPASVADAGFFVPLVDQGAQKKVAVFFASANSVYKSLPGWEVWEEVRDARSYVGVSAVVAHPPCRAWGRLRTFAKPRHDERDLAFFAVDQVRRCGGVLEHPASSLLWSAADLPAPGGRDSFGGWTLPIFQSWFGHRAPKPTWLYVVGVEPSALPVLPFELGIPSGRVALMGKAEREATPLELATWLVEVARKVSGSYCNTRTNANGLASTC